MEIKKILVPVDGSDPSERAFSYACAFAEKTGAEVILLYVVDADTLIYPVYRVSLAESDTSSIKKRGEDTLSLYANDAPEDVKIRQIVNIGVPGSSIIRTAEEIRNYQISLGIDASGNLPF